MHKLETEVVQSLRGLQYFSGEFQCSLQVHYARKPKKYTFQVLGSIIFTSVIESVKIVAAQQENAGEEEGEYTRRRREI